jgi:putative transposase
MLKLYKYKLKPDNNQIILLNKHFGCIRFIYNYFLNERKKEYETNNQTLNYYDNTKALTELKHSNEYIWLNEICAQSLQQSLKHLDGAYNGFFKGRTKFPNFKSKHNKNSFCVPQAVKLINNKLYIRKFKGGIGVIIDRKFKGIIKQCTITKTPTNEYFVSILVETEHVKLPKTNKSIGIDLGLKDFAITSEGFKYKNNKYTKQYEKKLKKAQQHLSKKTKNSKKFEQQRLKVVKIYKKITNSRVDNLHKVSTDLIKKYDIICLEDLNIKGMSTRCKPKQDKNGKYLSNGQSAKSGLNKSISNASWGTFVEMLNYKANWNDKQIVKINRFYPSSKTCHICGYINQDLNLSIREWKCPKCGIVHDRDINAAKNILKEGQKILLNDLTNNIDNNKSSGTDDNRRGDQIRPVITGTIDETSKILSIS